MSDLIILGTDTDAGKTTFALLWLALYHEQHDYWKPVETGPSDSVRVRALVPEAVVHPPARQYGPALAPPRAARLAGDAVPSAGALARLRPQPAAGKSLLVETFGSPLSPLNDTELQVSLLRALEAASVLIASSSLGAIGRTLQCHEALPLDLRPRAVVLLGAADAYAEEALRQHLGIPVFSLTPPAAWTPEGIRAAAQRQAATLASARMSLDASPAPAHDLSQRDRASVWHPYTSLRDADAPLHCIGAQDEFLHLADGRRVIDGISSWWTILHGHRHPALLAALAEAAKRFDPSRNARASSASKAVTTATRSAPWPSAAIRCSSARSSRCSFRQTSWRCRRRRWRRR
jgi:dethiobiotin synthetase